MDSLSKTLIALSLFLYFMAINKGFNTIGISATIVFIFIIIINAKKDFFLSRFMASRTDIKTPKRGVIKKDYIKINQNEALGVIKLSVIKPLSSYENPDERITIPSTTSLMYRNLPKETAVYFVKTIKPVDIVRHKIFSTQQRLLWVQERYVEKTHKGSSMIKDLFTSLYSFFIPELRLQQSAVKILLDRFDELLKIIKSDPPLRAHLYVVTRVSSTAQELEQSLRNKLDIVKQVLSMPDLKLEKAKIKDIADIVLGELYGFSYTHIDISEVRWAVFVILLIAMYIISSYMSPFIRRIAYIIGFLMLIVMALISFYLHAYKYMVLLQGNFYDSMEVELDEKHENVKALILRRKNRVTIHRFLRAYLPYDIFKYSSEKIAFIERTMQSMVLGTSVEFRQIFIGSSPIIRHIYEAKKKEYNELLTRGGDYRKLVELRKMLQRLEEYLNEKKDTFVILQVTLTAHKLAEKSAREHLEKIVSSISSHLNRVGYITSDPSIDAINEYFALNPAFHSIRIK